MERRARAYMQCMLHSCVDGCVQRCRLRRLLFYLMTDRLGVLSCMLNTSYYSATGRRAEYCDERVCLSQSGEWNHTS